MLIVEDSARNVVLEDSLYDILLEEDVSTHVMKQNDLLPYLKGTLTDAAGVAVNLTGATIVFSMRRGTAVKVDRAEANITNAALGKVEYRWQPGDTEDVGKFKGEFEALIDGLPLTFPNNKYIPIKIRDDIA